MRKIAVETGIDAQESRIVTDGDGSGGSFPVLPAGIALVLAAALGVWLYMTRIAE